ncbi:MAG: diacylglycerol kinase family protein [Planctomycetota bacterium]
MNRPSGDSGENVGFWSRTVRSFGFAVRGVRLAFREERHFRFHFFAAALVIAAGFVLRVSFVEWGLLLLCIATVLAAELFNTALERLAVATVREKNDLVRDALDAASGAVLVTAAGAAAVGLIVLGRAALNFFGLGVGLA